MELSEERKRKLSECLINAKKRRDDASEINTKLKGEISDVENRKKELRLQLNKYDESSQNKALSDKNDQLKNEIQTLLTKKAKINEDFSKCEALIKQVMKKLMIERNNKKKIDENKKDAVKDLEKLTIEVEKRSTEPQLKEKSEIISKEMKKKVSAWKKQNESLMNELNEKKAKLESMIGEQKDAKCQINQQMQEIAELEGRNHRRDATIEECKQDLADQSEENQNLVLYLQKVHDDRMQKESDVVCLKEKNKSQKRELKKLIAKKAKMEEDGKVISTKSQDVHIKLEDMINKTVNETQEEQNKNIAEAKEKERNVDESLASTKAEIAKQNEKLSQLKQQLEKEKESFQNTQKLHERKLNQLKEVQKQMMKTFNSDDEA